MACNVEDGYYFKEPITCSTCVYPCKTCSDSDSCLSCPDGRYFYGNYCYFSCPMGTWLDEEGMCNECSYVYCSLCDGLFTE